MPTIPQTATPIHSHPLPGLAARVALTLGLLIGVLLWAPAAVAEPHSADLSEPLSLKQAGRYEEAAQSFLALLPYLSGADARSARTHLAETYELAGAWPQAAAVWHEMARSTLDRTERSTALFREAAALQASGQPQEAADLYVAFYHLRPESPAVAEALSRAADCFAALGDWAVSAHYYQAALDGTSAGSDRLELAYKLSDAFLMVGDAQSALDTVVSEAASVGTEEQARYQYQRARLEIAAGLDRAGKDRLLSLISTDPRSSYAHPALVMLVEADEPVDEYLRGLVDYYADAFQPAVEAFERYLAADPSDRVASAHYYAGLSYRSLGDTQSALQHFDAGLALRDDPEAPRAWFGKAETEARAGDLEAAVDDYLALAAAHPAHETAPAARLQAGVLLQELDRVDEAIQVFASLSEGYSGTDMGREGALRAGLALFRRGDWAGAQTWFQTASDACSDCADAARYAYWLARALLAQGDSDAATVALNQAASSTAGGYYAYRARELLAGQDPLAGAGDSNLLLPAADDGRAEAEAWLQAHYSSDWDPATAPASLSSDPRLPALEEYYRLGLRQKVSDLALSLSREHLRDGPVQFWLALWLRDRGFYRPSIMCAANLVYVTPNAPQELPAFIWRLAYPTYYSDLVLTEAASRGVDPLLFFALMRQESLFDYSIGSRAGAQGLAQVMPTTGEWIALQLGDSGYSPADLLRPYIAVRYGVYYLKVQVDYLGNHIPAALAAYNAGPGNAEHWLALSGHDSDLFYESVAFTETRKYLATVLPNYLEYVRLYRG